MLYIYTILAFGALIASLWAAHGVRRLSVRLSTLEGAMDAHRPTPPGRAVAHPDALEAMRERDRDLPRDPDPACLIRVRPTE